MPSIRTSADYAVCLRQILHDRGGRASRGQVYRDFEGRYTSSIPRDQAAPDSPDQGAPPRWQRAIDGIAELLVQRRELAATDDGWALI
jgi:hypothetical protein